MKNQNIKTIAYVTGTRADFGLMNSILTAIQNTPLLRLNLYAIGMHTMKKFGYTFDEVKAGFPSAKKIDVRIRNDSREAMSRYMSDCIQAITAEFILKRPDVVLVLGDRAEMFAVASACLYLGIPVAHIQGGDKSGTVDDVTRQAITKLSHLHFPATKESMKRLILSGEEHSRIHVVGSPSLDFIRQKTLLSKQKTYGILHIPLSERYVLMTLHPETSNVASNRHNVRVVLSAIETINLPTVIIYPNADPGNSVIIEAIEKKRKNSRYHIYRNMSYEQFLSVARYAAVWIGNSSAGCIESPSLHVPVVNVGSRQKGRTIAKNIVNVSFDSKDIVKAMHQSLTDKRFLHMIARMRNPWGDGHTANRITHVLKGLEVNDRLLQK